MKFTLFPQQPQPSERERLQMEREKTLRTQARAKGLILFLLATVFGSAAVVAVTRRAQKAEYDW